MAVSTMVGTAKNKLCNLVFLFLCKPRKLICNPICKVVNVMEIVYYYENSV